MKGLTLNFSFGSPKVVTLKAFLDHVPTKAFLDKVVEFTTFTEMSLSTWTNANSGLNIDDGYYARKRLRLSRRSVRGAKTSLLKQRKPRYIDKEKSLLEMADYMVRNQAMENGQSEFLVRIAPRTWLVAQVSDYTYLLSEKGSALICYQSRRLKIYKVKRSKLSQLKIGA